MTVGAPHFTTGNQRAILHLKVIGRGGSGEVHKMYSEDDNQIFARKVQRAFGQVTKEDIKTELDAVIAIRRAGEHKNIIKILRHGTLPLGDYYYIDMEFCDFSLHQYIHDGIRERENISPLVANQNNWSIMTQISKGLCFLHRNHYVHRDLKPQNILYDRLNKVWKLIDFGFMCQATSKKIVVTATGRGTQGYRAPEVLSDSVTGFNNKADIWAVGCILYELMTGNKLFTNDFHVREYQFSDMAVKISVRDVPHVLQLHLSEIVTELLHRDYQQRPSAKQLLWVFHAYLIIVRLSIIERRDLAKSLPSHREWTGLINGCQNLNQLNARLLEYFKSRRDYNAACFLCTSLILRRSPSEELAQQMAELYKLRDNNEQAIADCRSLIEHFPSNASLLGHLTTFCQLKGGNSLAGKVWKELVDSQPTNALWKTARDEVIVETCITKGDWESAIVALKRLVTKNSNQPSYMVELEAAFRACHMSAEDRIAVWAEFVDQNPRAGVLQDQLWKACYQLNHPDLVVNQWEKLVEAHPKEMTLYDRLSSACKLPGSSRDPVRVWEGLVERNPGPSGYLFSFPLDQALLESGDIRQAILVCRRRIMKVPLEPDIEQLKKALGQVTVDEAFVVWNELLTQYPRHMTIKSCFELAYIKTRRGC